MDEAADVLTHLMRADQLEEQDRWEEAAWTRLHCTGSRWYVQLSAGGRVWAWDQPGATARLWVSDEEGAEDWLWEGGAWSVSRHLWTGDWSPWMHAPCPPAVRAAVEAACRLRTEALFARGESP